MTPESQRIAIGKAAGELDTFRWSFRYWSKSRNPITCGGWSNQKDAEAESEKLAAQGFECGGISGARVTPDRLPDYLNDLNAMHEAEKVLTPEQRVIYWDRLQDVIEYSWHATAAQRAEEFLRTLNLWKE